MAWAQACAGDKFLVQWMQNRDDREAEQKAGYWYSLAVVQGDMGARIAIGRMWIFGIVTSVCKSDEEALEVLRPAARLGSSSAQSLISKILWKYNFDSSEGLIWCTLAAGQGNSDAQKDLSTFFHLVDEDRDLLSEATFKVLYWGKKAALRGIRSAQLNTATLLLQIKERLFDGVPNQVGHSCLPEVFFWEQQARDNNGYDWYGIDNTPTTTRPAYTEESCVASCGCCGKTPTAQAGGDAPDSHKAIGELVAKIHRCKQCRSLGYCSIECQRKHWKMGHKVDCRQVHELKKAMKPIRHSMVTSRNKSNA
jgi:MYND finger